MEVTKCYLPKSFKFINHVGGQINNSLMDLHFNYESMTIFGNLTGPRHLCPSEKQPASLNKKKSRTLFMPKIGYYFPINQKYNEPESKASIIRENISDKLSP